MLANFTIFFTVGLSSKFATRIMSYSRSLLKCITTLPCEIQKINSSNSLELFNSVFQVLVYVSSRVILNVQNALLWHEHAPRNVCATHTLHHQWQFVPSHARRYFSLSMSWTWRVSQMFLCMHRCLIANLLVRPAVKNLESQLPVTFIKVMNEYQVVCFLWPTV